MSTRRKKAPAPAIAEITFFTKAKGPLTKRITLAEDGGVVSDGSACTMARGRAQRCKLADIGQLAAVIEKLNSDQAIGLGALRDDLPDEVGIVTKAKLNGVERPDVIARTGDNIIYREGRPAFTLLDFDTKGTPPDVATRLDELGGFWAALVAVLPALGDAAHLIRRSTSAGLRRTDTSEELTGSGGLHGYHVVKDGADIERFLDVLHQRCWLAGLGWMMIGVGGQLLERSIVDRMVGAPERLVFEGAPILAPPLAQDAASRVPTVTSGKMLDTIAACPQLALVEQHALAKLKAAASQRLLPARTKAREAYVASQAQQLAKRTGCTTEEAARAIEQQCRGVLLADIALPFDDTEFDGMTVADVLSEPARFDGATLADPIEGIDYGRAKAKVLRHADGTPWIRSFAHGLTTYRLKYDHRAVRLRVEQATDTNVIDTFVRLAANAAPGLIGTVEHR
jgi:hypothetical protein